jgi:hypothetical protein
MNISAMNQGAVSKHIKPRYVKEIISSEKPVFVAVSEKPFLVGDYTEWLMTARTEKAPRSLR